MKPKMITVLAVLLTACGGDDDVASVPGADQTTVPSAAEEPEPGDPDQGETADESTEGSDEPTPEATGPLGENTIRIGDQTWKRTLPMTTGQCLVYRNSDVGGDSGSEALHEL